MSFDFDKLTDRRNTFSYKWKVEDGELPMWVADMDFECAPPIVEAITKRAQHAVFGYSDTPDAFFEAVSDYFMRRHGFRIPTEHMIYSNGVVAAISSAIRRLTQPNESVLVQAPVYNIFYNSIINSGRRVLSSDLVYDGKGYSIDFLDLEEKLARPETSLMILCNPHNPVGRTWSKQELTKIGDLCIKHDVAVFSDEIHCDFTFGKPFIPFASLGEAYADISVSAVAASKTFNVAGLQSACLYAKSPRLRYLVWRGVNTDEVGEPNCFAMCANIAAFSECDEWVDEMRQYILESRIIAREYINGRIPGLYVPEADATYLLWIDVSGVSDSSVEFAERVRELTGLYLSDGEEYGKAGKTFVRMNLATQRERVMDGLSRLERAVKIILNEKN